MWGGGREGLFIDGFFRFIGVGKREEFFKGIFIFGFGRTVRIRIITFSLLEGLFILCFIRYSIVLIGREMLESFFFFYNCGWGSGREGEFIKKVGVGFRYKEVMKFKKFRFLFWMFVFLRLGFFILVVFFRFFGVLIFDN